MKINEVINNDLDNILDTISQECSDFLEEGGWQLLFRGIKNANSPTLLSQSREGRRAKDSSWQWQEAIDTKLKEAGYSALRSNSIFVSGNQQVAQAYGDLYCIFPIDGFQYTWSGEIRDIFAEYSTDEYNWDRWTKHVSINPKTDPLLAKSYNFFVDLKTLTGKEFAGKYAFENSDLKDAINSKHEIYIRGSYYAILYKKLEDMGYAENWRLFL
jgi:hypothetical protein